MNLRPGQPIGPWTLVAELGAGGNAQVWRASGVDGEVALKVLSSRGGDRYARFRDEVRFMQDHAAGEPGVLPLLGAHLPERPRAGDPAWLATPIAQTIRTALGEEPGLGDVVDAMAVIAGTLARLAERGVFHRDVKPDNLFRLDGAWVVGDWGLVRYPQKQALTVPDRKLGPMHFLAPEMLTAPDAADPGPADVYSTAKTLWVLCTGQRYPPPGQQRLDEPMATLGGWVSGARVETLDLLIERATGLNPAARPTMTELAAELRAWIVAGTPAAAQEPAQLIDLAKRIKAMAEPSAREQEEAERRDRRHIAAWHASCALLEPLRADLAQAFPRVDERGDDLPPEVAAALEGPATNRHANGLAGTYPDPTAVELRAGLLLQRAPDDTATLALWLRVHDPYAGPVLLWWETRDFRPGTSRQEVAMRELGAAATAHLRDGIERVVSRMELRTDADRYAMWTGEGSDAGTFAGPWSCFCPNAEGDAGCYVVDSGNNRILRFGPGGAPRTWHTRGGEPGTGYGETAFPTGGCFNHNRYVWIADYDNHRIIHFDEHGGPVEGFGLEPPGPEVLLTPADVASDPSGHVYVVDRGRHVIVKFTPRGGPAGAWGGQGREPGKLASPCGIAVRHGAFVYVADTGNDRIQKFTAHGKLVTQWGGQGSAPGCFRSPHGIALDIDENVFVADADNHRIQQFTADGDLVRCWGANGGDGTPGSERGQFRDPRGVGVDGNGDIYVVECAGARVQRFSRSYIEQL